MFKFSSSFERGWSNGKLSDLLNVDMEFIIGDVEISVVVGFGASMSVDEAMGVVGMANACCSIFIK